VTLQPTLQPLQTERRASGPTAAPGSGRSARSARRPGTARSCCPRTATRTTRRRRADLALAAASSATSAWSPAISSWKRVQR
jgi:hypothetical protein